MTVHRASTSVWDRRGWNGSRLPTAARCAAAGVGLALIWWAVWGDEVPDASRWLTRLRDRAQDDPVHEASADSFPASDAPSFTPTVGTGMRHGVQ